MSYKYVCKVTDQNKFRTALNDFPSGTYLCSVRKRTEDEDFGLPYMVSIQQEDECYPFTFAIRENMCYFSELDVEEFGEEVLTQPPLKFVKVPTLRRKTPLQRT